MATKGQHVQDNSIVERRLRPIYDWLDIGNNKKALQECEKVLKKTPALQCAKALKAITLYRMGKEIEAVTILNLLREENPTDDATLQAMTLCYRELQQLEKVCQLYETAIKADPTNEELLTHLFMSYARIFDFKSQQKTAMTLYKHKPKTPYYCWAVMSIILQATRGEGRFDKNKRKLLLSLAERMMEKLILDGKLDAEQEVQLYIMVLELQEKFQEILVILDGPLASKLNCVNIGQFKLKYLKSLKQWKEINLICKKIVIESVDRWNIWKDYISSAFHLMSTVTNCENHTNELETCDDTPEKCHEFICRIIENGTENDFFLRGPYLARFELCAKLIEHKLDPSYTFGEIIELFIEYFRKFGHKPCCVNDLRTYLILLNTQQQNELVTRLIKYVGISATSVPQSEQQMQRHLCALQLSRLCSAHRNLSSDHLKALVTAFSLHYEHGYQNYGTNLLVTDLGPSDLYTVLAAHLLYDLALLEKSSTPIIAALVLLENMLKKSPSNFHAKLLAIRLYHTIGGTIGAQLMYSSLDTKHLQLDSLGFVHCARLPTSGIFSMCTNLYDITLKFFSTNYKDSSDHITFSYKYGSFIKLDEFMDFRERLNNSLHYLTVAIDRIVLTLIECTNLDTLYNLDLSPKDNTIDWDSIIDNHDLSVYLSWDPERLTVSPENDPEVINQFSQNLQFLKLRTPPLFALAISIEIVKSTDGVRSQRIEELTGVINNWGLLWDSTKPMEPVSQNQITLPLPSRLHVTIATPMYQIIGGLFQIFIALCLEKRIESQQTAVIEAINKLLFPRENFENDNLVERRKLLETLVNYVEIFSISNLIILLCHEVINKSTNRKNRKKLTTDGSPISRISDVIKTRMVEFSNDLEEWSNSNVNNDVITQLESLNLNQANDEVCLNITNSYVTACREILCVIRNKIKMLI